MKKENPSESASLLKTVALDEAGLLDKIKSALHQKDDRPPVFAARPGAGETASEQVLQSLFSVPSGERRLIILLSDGDLTNLYQPKGGNEKLVNALAKDNPGAIYAAFPKLPNPSNAQPDGGKPVFVLLPKGDVEIEKIPTIRRNAVMLNVPVDIADYFVSRPVVTFNQAKDILINALDHRNYIGTIDTVAIQKIRGTPSTVEDLLPVFDMKKMLRGYAPAVVRHAAIAEWEKRNETPPTEKSSLDKDERASVRAASKKLINFVADQISALGSFPTDPAARKALRDAIVAKAKSLAGSDDLASDVIDGMLNNYPTEGTGKIRTALFKLMYGEFQQGAENSDQQKVKAEPEQKNDEKRADADSKKLADIIDSLPPSSEIPRDIRKLAATLASGKDKHQLRLLMRAINDKLEENQ